MLSRDLHAVLKWRSAFLTSARPEISQYAVSEGILWWHSCRLPRPRTPRLHLMGEGAVVGGCKHKGNASKPPHSPPVLVLCMCARAHDARAAAGTNSMLSVCGVQRESTALELSSSYRMLHLH